MKSRKVSYEEVLAMVTQIGSPRPKPVALVVKPAKDIETKPVKEEKLQFIRELLFEDVNYNQVILETEKLSKKQIENNPELWVYLAVAYSFTGNQNKADIYTEKFAKWFKANETLPQAIVLQITLLHRLIRNEEALEIGSMVIQSAAFENFSGAEKKQVYLLTATCYILYLEIDTQKSIDNYKKAEQLLKKALAIQINNNKSDEWLTYRCYLALAEAYKGHALYSEDTHYFKLASEALTSALKVRPTASRPCRNWKIMLRDNNIDEPAPEKCQENYPEEPSRINIEIKYQ